MSNVLRGEQIRLTAWTQYQEQLPPDKTKASQAAFDFRARWRLAKGFTGIQVDVDLKDLTVDSYHALLKVVLACTAREQLAAAMCLEDKFALPVEDDALAAQIRKVLYVSDDSRFAECLRKDSTRNARHYMQEFWSGRTQDLLNVANAIRNGVAHGAITPTGAGLTTAPKIKIVLALADAILDDSDRRFTEWVAQQPAAGA